jgi:hypothetical protein
MRPTTWLGLAGVLLAGGARAGDRMRVYVDPATGAFTGPPATAAASPTVAGAQSRSADDLVEEPAPGGGTMVHLRGRFQSPVADGTAPARGPEPPHGTR